MADALERLTTALGERYAVERQIGVGGMATVYLARDLRHDRLVALKLLRPELAAVIGAERFLAEIRTTAKLQHPHILPLFDSGEADGLLYYVMPFVEGVSLRDRLNREKQLPLSEAIRIATEVASAAPATWCMCRWCSCRTGRKKSGAEARRGAGDASVFAVQRFSTSPYFRAELHRLASARFLNPHSALE